MADSLVAAFSYVNMDNVMLDIVLLDGGLGQEISLRYTGQTHALWSITVMLEEPEIVLAVHRDFIKAGAKVLTLNTYTATPTRMAMHGYEDHFEEVHKTAIKIANDAIAASAIARQDITIAGCLPPLVASYVHECSHDYDKSLDEFRRITALQKDHVDVFFIETMTNWEEARAAITAAREVGKPVYASFTLNDDASNQLRSGERLEWVVEQMAAHTPDGVMINCSYPEAVSAAMPILQKSGLMFGGYANGFTSIKEMQPGQTVDELTARTDLPPTKYAEYAMAWIETGAQIIGGCCEISPAHIAELAKQISAKGHDIVCISH